MAKVHFRLRPGEGVMDIDPATGWGNLGAPNDSAYQAIDVRELHLNGSYIWPADMNCYHRVRVQGRDAGPDLIWVRKRGEFVSMDEPEAPVVYDGLVNYGLVNYGRTLVTISMDPATGRFSVNSRSQP